MLLGTLWYILEWNDNGRLSIAAILAPDGTAQVSVKRTSIIIHVATNGIYIKWHAIVTSALIGKIRTHMYPCLL